MQAYFVSKIGEIFTPNVIGDETSCRRNEWDIDYSRWKINVKKV